MKKLMMAVLAACLSIAFAGSYAADDAMKKDGAKKAEAKKDDKAKDDEKKKGKKGDAK